MCMYVRAHIRNEAHMISIWSLGMQLPRPGPAEDAVPLRIYWICPGSISAGFWEAVWWWAKMGKDGEGQSVFQRKRLTADPRTSPFRLALQGSGSSLRSADSAGKMKWHPACTKQLRPCVHPIACADTAGKTENQDNCMTIVLHVNKIQQGQWPEELLNSCPLLLSWRDVEETSQMEILSRPWVSRPKTALAKPLTPKIWDMAGDLSWSFMIFPNYIIENQQIITNPL